MVTDEMVERAAKAIRHADGGHIVPNELERYRRLARAALAAMAETPAPLSHTGIDRGE